MTRRKPKLGTQVADDEVETDTCKDLDVIEVVPDIAPEPVEVVNHDVLQPRRASRYKAML